MRKITKIFRIYGKIARPWLTLIVYLWTLELLATFSIRATKPLFDRLADCSGILATLAFWTCVTVLLPSLVALIVGGQRICFFNTLAVRVALVLVSAFYFVRWLFNWTVLWGDSSAIPYALLGAGLLLAGYSLYCRKNRVSTTFSLDDGWAYFAQPVLVTAMFILTLHVGNNFWAELRNRRSLTRPSTSRPNVILVVSDALRAQSMSLYDYSRKTTPFLDRFAHQSNVYTQMYANSTSTRPSLTTILSGKRPFSHGRLTKFLPTYDSPENLLALLRDHGYATAAISSNADATFYSLDLVKYLVYGEQPNFRRLTLSFLRDNGVYPTSLGARMYDEFARWFLLGYPEETLGYGPASETVKLATQTLIELPEPFFLFVHLHEPHDPYEAPPPFKNKFAKFHNRETRAKLSAFYYQRYQPDLQPLVDDERDHYDEVIAYLDAELGKFVNALQRSQRGQNTLLILTADHGESFERGFLNHGDDLYESSIHVPLIVRFPGQTKGERSSLPVQSIDIAPTILDVSGISIPTWMDGEPVTSDTIRDDRETIVTNYKDPDRDRVYEQPTKLAIRWRQYKLIVSCDAQRAELYDLAVDPDEKSDLSRIQTETVRKLWKKLERHLAKQSGNQKMVCQLTIGTGFAGE